jgi:PAS domain S-box-containing protein
MPDEISTHGQPAKELGATAQQLRAMFSQSAVGIAIADLEGRFIEANDMACRMFGYRLEDLRGRSFADLTHPDDLARTREEVRRLGAGEIGSYALDKRYLRPDGSAFWSSTTVTLLRNPQGQPEHFFGVLQDIDDRKQGEEVRSRLAAVVNSSDDAIITKTLDGIITTWNPSAVRMFGYTPGEVIGRPITILIPDDHKDEEPQILLRLHRGEHIHHYETVRRRKDGSIFHVSLSVSPIKDVTGRIVGAAKIARDITQRKLDEEALREANRRKDEFLATLAHELRNPLAPIRQAAALAGTEGASEEQKRWGYQVIERQVRHMSALLDDLLDIARITRGAFDLRPVRTSIGEVMEAAIETARPAMELRHHVLHVEAPQREAQLQGDPLRLAQILANLLLNAAKYTDTGGTITLRATADAQTVEFAVRDTGVGIPAEALPQLFAMFTQVKSSRARSDGGLGIGLALARGLAELHGGTIEARSEGPGRGSEFTVRIPRNLRAAEGSAPAAQPASREAQPRTVLIADDNEDAAQTLALLLQISGHHVVVAHDGEQAVARYEETRPQFALLDIGMPGLDGYEVARRLRATAGDAPLTLVAATGWGQDADKAKARAAGFDLHLTKPIDPDRILALLAAGGPGGLRP